MRIGVLTSLYPSPDRPYEGIFAARKWEGMTARGHVVEVVVPVPWAPRLLSPLMGEARAQLARIPSRETRSGIPVHRPRYVHLPGRAKGNAARFAAAGLRSLLARDGARPDAVVCDYAWPASAAVRPLVAAGVPVVVNGRGSDVLQVGAIAGLRERLADGLASASALTAVSQDLLDAMLELGGEKAVAELTPNGVDAQRFSPGDRTEARRRLGQPLEGHLVVCVGHLIERKDPLLALAAFKQAAASDARLVFVGRGPLREALESAAREARLEGRVVLVGERPPEELVDWYRAADVLLLTSSREGRPNVVLEALSAGCPVLATEAGGTAEILPDESMLARTRDAVEVGAKLRELLAKPPAAAALRAGVSHLTWDASLDALEGVLNAVAERDRA